MKRLEVCPLCEGSGLADILDYMEFGESGKCPACDGLGQLPVLDESDLDISEDIE